MTSIRDREKENTDLESSVSKLSIGRKPWLENLNPASSQPQSSTLVSAPPTAPDGPVNTETIVPPEEERPAGENGDGGENEDEDELLSEVDFHVEADNPEHNLQRGDEVDGFNAWATSARVTKAIEHSNEANMFELARFFLMGKDDLKYQLQENRQEGESEYILSKKKLKGFLRDAYRYQLYGAFKAMKLMNTATLGALLAEEMGLGKTIEALIII
jgi:hypothetical protein